jgi:hypothetical protein
MGSRYWESFSTLKMELRSFFDSFIHFCPVDNTGLDTVHDSHTFLSSYIIASCDRNIHLLALMAADKISQQVLPKEVSNAEEAL